MSGTVHSNEAGLLQIRTIPYAIVDVFAERALEGNSLAIFPDAHTLTTEQMQSIARETNLSETTFILPRAAEVERELGIQVRIFTTQEELPFAGHPTLGTATWLHLNHPTLRGSECITLDLPVGPMQVRFAAQQSGPGIFGTMRQNDPVFGDTLNRTAAAQALGLSPDDLDPHLPIQIVSTGMPFCIVPLRSLEVAARLAIPQPLARAFLAGTGARFFHCLAPAAPESGAHWHARMQFYNGEDPATGSASGCAIAYLVHYKLVASAQPVIIEQGVEMLRPSRIQAQASLNGSSVCDVFVGGRTIPIATGRFFLP
jgi:trans-2,3-dihydro-3-hydroxyanthranilate isomerase